MKQGMENIISPMISRPSKRLHRKRDYCRKKWKSSRGFHKVYTMGCPLCGEFTHKASTRLIQDSCGHVKCRMCLLKEENGCRICEAESTINPIGSFNYPLPPSRSPNYEFPNCVPLELTINKIPVNLELNALPQSVEKQITEDENNLENLQGQSNVPIETNGNVQQSQVNSIAENQNIDKQSASIPQILEIENANSNDSNDSQDLSEETILVIDEEKEENTKDSQNKNFSNQTSFQNKNETIENELIQVNSPISSCPKENLNQIAKRRIDTSSIFHHGISVLQKSFASIGNLSKLEGSLKLNSELSNKTPKYLSSTSQEPKQLDLAGIPYKSPIFRLSNYVTLNKRNEKRDVSPLSVDYRSPDFRLSDYLVFKNRSSQDEVTQKIEKNLNEVEKKSSEYVSSDGFLVQRISASQNQSNQSLMIETEDNLQNNTLNEPDTAINKRSTVLDTSSYPILKKRFMLNSSENCNKKENQNVEQDYESTNSLSLKEERSKNENKTGDEENKENKKKLKEKEKSIKRSIKVKSYARATALKKHIISSKNKFKNVTSLKMRSNIRMKKEENLKEKNVPIATRKGERQRKRKVLIYENEVLEVLPKKRRGSATSKSDLSPSHSASPEGPPRPKRRKSKKDWSHVERLPGIPARYRCNVCNVSFGHWRGRSEHAACRSGEPPFRCTTCDRSFYKRTHFEYHERAHTGEKPYICNLCSKAFAQKSKLNRHLTIHKQQYDIECDICKRTFSSKDYLKHHLITHTESVFKCSKCPKTFTLDANRRRHELSHTAEKTFACDLCSSRFKSKYLLTRHKRLHEKSRPYSCEHCDSVFLTKFEVQRHISIHTDSKPFACDFCNTEFRRKDNLKRHVMHHHSKNTEESTENSTGSDDQRIPIAGPSTSGISTSKKKHSGVEEAKQTKKEDSTPEKVKNSTKPKRVSRTNSSSSGSMSSPKSSQSIELKNAVPISIRPTNSQFVFVDDIPREEALLLNKQIEIKFHEQKSYCKMPGLTRKPETRLRNGRSRSNSNSNDATSMQNQEKRKTGSSGDEDSRPKDASYVHWRRRTAETLRSKWNKKLQKD